MPVHKNMILMLTDFLFAVIRYLRKTDKGSFFFNFCSYFQRFQLIMLGSIDSGTLMIQNIHGSGIIYKKQQTGSREQQTTDWVQLLKVYPQ